MNLFDWSKVRVILIIGTGRTGTEFLARAFSAAYENAICSAHEPIPDLLDLSVRRFKDRLSERKVVSVLRDTRYELVKRGTFPFYIESNNNFSFLLPYLRRAFPDLKIIYFTRDPMSFLVSEMNKLHGKRKFRLFDVDDTRERITPLHLRDEYADSWRNFTRPMKIIWYWSACNRYVTSQISDYDFIQIKYEDFFDGRRACQLAEQIVAFCGLPPIGKDKIGVFDSDIKVNAARGSDFVASDLTEEESAFFDVCTQELKMALGY